jgi:hypothetical protein
VREEESMSRRFGRTVLTLGLLITANGLPARAQSLDLDKVRGLPGLLENQTVQKELKLSDEQVKNVTAIAREHNQRMDAAVTGVMARYRGLPPVEQEAKAEERAALLTAISQSMIAQADARLKEVLSADQFRRYKQISVWGRIPALWKDPDVESLLNLTEEQRAKIRQILQDNLDNRPRMAEVIKSVADPKAIAERWRALIRENNERTTARAVGLLNDAQQAIWKEMTGEPHEFAPPQPNR